MTVEPFKYLLQAVARERDDDTGRIVRELPAETVHVFSAEQAAAAILEFEQRLDQGGEQSNGAGTDRDSHDHMRQPGLPREHA